ncbi:MAG: P27 family phage terminase small subunit [Methylobacter tundripaludum]|nr:P27 family phage terminase small subunit [Methylobacter tundripaludum]
MAQGRKPQLVTGDKFAALPLHDDPQSVHVARANALRPGDDLSEDELKVWDRIAPHLAMLGRLKPHFVDALAEYCRIVRRLADARKYLDDSEWTYITTGRNGQQFKSRPEVAQLNDDWRKWRSLVGEFGLAPAAERGMQSGQGDLFDDFDAF